MLKKAGTRTLASGRVFLAESEGQPPRVAEAAPTNPSSLSFVLQRLSAAAKSRRPSPADLARDGGWLLDHAQELQPAALAGASELLAALTVSRREALREGLQSLAEAGEKTDEVPGDRKGGAAAAASSSGARRVQRLWVEAQTEEVTRLERCVEGLVRELLKKLTRRSSLRSLPSPQLSSAATLRALSCALSALVRLGAASPTEKIIQEHFPQALLAATEASSPAFDGLGGAGRHCAADECLEALVYLEKFLFLRTKIDVPRGAQSLEAAAAFCASQFLRHHHRFQRALREGRSERPDEEGAELTRAQRVEHLRSVYKSVARVFSQAAAAASADGEVREFFAEVGFLYLSGGLLCALHLRVSAAAAPPPALGLLFSACVFFGAVSV